MIYSVAGDVITEPISVSIPNELSDEQKDTALQNDAWNLFTDLIPRQNRQMVVQYNVFTDGYSNTLAAVDQKHDDPSQWVLEIDIADLEDKDSFLFTLVHEYAHLLTLNASQVIPDQEIVDDPTNLSLQQKKPPPVRPISQEQAAATQIRTSILFTPAFGWALTMSGKK